MFPYREGGRRTLGLLQCRPLLRLGGRKSGGFQIMELITRAKTRLFVILVGNDQMYAETKTNFQQAVELGLVDKLVYTS